MNNTNTNNNIDYDSYIYMTDQNIDKLMMHLQNIKNDRKQQTLEHFRNKDTDFIQQYIIDNEYILPEYVYEFLNCSEVWRECEINDINFVIELQKTKHWKERISYISYYYEKIVTDAPTIEYVYQHAPDLFNDVFKEHSHIMTYPLETFRKLDQLGVLDISTILKYETVKDFMPENLLLYILEKTPNHFKTKKIKDFYFTMTIAYRVETLEILKDLCPAVTNMKFQHAVGYDDIEHTNKVFEDRLYDEEYLYEFFCYSDRKMKYILEHHRLETEDIVPILYLFEKDYEQIQEKIVTFLEILNNSDPIMLEKIKETATTFLESDDVKNFIAKTILSFELQDNLSSKEHVQRHKL